VTFVAKLLSRNGVAVLCSFISPYIERRNKTRQEIGSFVECYVECPLEVLVERDVKGLYKKALAGEIENFTGVSDPYEPPPNPEITVNSATQTIEESLAIILQRLEEMGYVSPATPSEDVPPAKPSEGAYDEEEEKEVEDRLRALGYI
jgi:adenylylsulfate kinase-like enzyme